MRNTMTPLGILAGLMIAANAAAADMPPLAKANGCAACHTIDKKMNGPAWVDIAKKYKGDKGAEAKLIARVKNGSVGVWGAIAMPAQSAKDADIKTLVHFILGLAK